MTATMNVADVSVKIGETDLTDRFRPRLISLSITEKRGEEADQLDIVIDDSDGRMALPDPGAVLRVALGWKAGGEVSPGLIDKGAFKVDSVTHAGAPDTITIRARSADFTSAIQRRRDTVWRDTTLGAVLRDLAGRNGLVARVAAALAAIPVAALTQSRESDVAFLRRLGRDHDAVATIKAGALLFAPVGSGRTATGTALPALSIRRRDGDRHSWSIEKRDEAKGVTAAWHDRAGAERKTVTVGAADGAKRLRKVYPTEAAARAAAKAEKGRLDRAPAKLGFSLALGRPDVYPEQRVTVSGFKDRIDATRWLIVEARHTLSGNGGLTTELQMESAP